MPELTPFATPGDALAHQVAEQPEKEAFIFPHTGERMTFAEWQADAQALARGLLDLGYRPGDHIGILAESRMEWPVCQMAIALMQRAPSARRQPRRPMPPESSPTRPR